MRQVARHVGVSHSTVVRWCKKAPENVGTIYEIPTKNSRPKSSPRRIDEEIVERILELRDTQRKNGPEAIHQMLLREGTEVSFSTVYRTLKTHGRIAQRSPWKKWHRSGERPVPKSAGTLVQMDTVHIMKGKKERLYVFTVLDVHSRWAYARASERLSAHLALGAFTRMYSVAPFVTNCVQTDHGPEFTQHFTTYVQAQGVRHRHIRIRQPNDNAHIERFNRTLQEEMEQEIRKYRNNIPWLNRSITEYLEYYNNERLHAGIDHKTPNEMLQVVQRS